MTDFLNQHGYHPATPETAPKHDQIRQHCIGLAQTINRLVPEGMERDEAQKALHVVRMWANMGIAVHGAPMATEEQRTTPQPTYGQEHIGTNFRVRMFTCPNCGEKVQAREKGHINPHWEDTPYGKTDFTCTKADEMAG